MIHLQIQALYSYIYLCREHGMYIMNGRKPGDEEGSYTSFQALGESMVDYAIATPRLYAETLTMKVGEYDMYKSDHCPITVEVSTSTALPKSDADDNFGSLTDLIRYLMEPMCV